ncbi:hypothetical protein [Paenibacillus sp. O199]|uniref:hypothetical protein n=1 Tax=Paenibacillus sp. O199 TaxID=1643925 RepID=UPI000AC786C5|nr:hypothetical protein [Paenibacillus sp. O199]
MKDELVITLKSTNSASDIIDFVTAVNKTNNLSALVLPRSDNSNQIQIEIYKINS